MITATTLFIATYEQEGNTHRLRFAHPTDRSIVTEYVITDKNVNTKDFLAFALPVCGNNILQLLPDQLPTQEFYHTTVQWENGKGITAKKEKLKEAQEQVWKGMWGN